LTLDELDEATRDGTRALEIAERLGDLKLRIVATSHLEQAYYYRGRLPASVRVRPDNLAALPPLGQRVFRYGLAASVFGRAWLIMSLAELGRFAEAAECEAEAIRIAEPTQHAHTIGWAHLPASMPHLFKGRLGEGALTGRTLDKHAWDFRCLRSSSLGRHLLRLALAEIGEASEALNRVREGEQLLERQAARGIVGHRGWAYGAAVAPVCCSAGSTRRQRLGDRAIESSRHQPGFTAHALRLLGDIAAHPDRFDPESGAARYREALALARLHGMRPLVAQLPPRPEQALQPHRRDRACP